jgi:hypothetical protein
VQLVVYQIELMLAGCMHIVFWPGPVTVEEINKSWLERNQGHAQDKQHIVP